MYEKNFANTGDVEDTSVDEWWKDKKERREIKFIIRQTKQPLIHLRRSELIEVGVRLRDQQRIPWTYIHQVTHAE